MRMILGIPATHNANRLASRVTHAPTGEKRALLLFDSDDVEASRAIEGDDSGGADGHDDGLRIALDGEDRARIENGQAMRPVDNAKVGIRFVKRSPHDLTTLFRQL